MVEITVIIVACLVGVITQRIVGFGIAPFLSPVVLIFLNPASAVITTIFVGTLSCLMLLYRARQAVMPRVIGRIVLTAIPGLILGSLIVTRIEKALLQIIVGVVVITAILIQEYALPKPTRRLGVTKGISAVGFLAGLMNATAANGAPPMAMWLRTHAVTSDQIRQNLAAMFIIVNSCSLVAIIAQRPSSLNLKVITLFFVLIPSVVIGNYIGNRLMSKVDRKVYEKLFVIAVLLTGSTSIVLGVTHYI